MIKKVDDLVVQKPWGNEYIVCQNKTTATKLLKLKYNKKTSLHCHPKKKTGFILLDGKVEVMLGFYEKKILNSPSKLTIRPGLFHSTKALSKNGASILEIETPINKNDLVRFEDDYGRENKPYENRKKMTKKTKDDIFFKIPRKIGINHYRFKNIKISLEVHNNTNELIKRPKKTIFAILGGGLVDHKKRCVLSPGDIVQTETITKLSKVFKIHKKLTILTCKKA